MAGGTPACHIHIHKEDNMIEVRDVAELTCPQCYALQCQCQPDTDPTTQELEANVRDAETAYFDTVMDMDKTDAEINIARATLEDADRRLTNHLANKILTEYRDRQTT